MPLARTLTPLALIATVLTGAGCATIVNGRTQAVRVVSEPAGAAVYLNGRPVGTTPTTVVVPRRGRVDLRLLKVGFAPATVALGHRGSWWLAGNAWTVNPLAAQGMDSMSQWATAASSWFAAVMAVDVVTGGAYVRPHVVSVPLAVDSETRQHRLPPSARCAGGCDRRTIPARR